jgi:cephalosporin-C deacetylase-like acetyl esterase
MANAIFPAWKSAVMQAAANSSLTGTLKAALIDTGSYTYSSAHDFWDDASAAVVGTPQTLSSKTYTAGTLDADDVTFTAVSGNSVEAIIIYIDTGVAGTSRLVAYLDTGYTGLPVTPNGGSISITWDAAGIFSL